MDLQKLLHLIVLIVGVIVAFVLIALFLKVAVNLLQLALVVAVILVLYFGAERLFGKGGR